MVNTLCDDIYTLFVSGAKENMQKLRANVHELTRHFFRNPITLEALDAVCDLERRLLHMNGSQKQFIEEDLFLVFTEVARLCVRENADEDTFLLLNEQLITHEDDNPRASTHIMASRLVEFADELFQFTKPRDNFATKRKAHALGMLSALSEVYEIPEAYATSVGFLKSKKRDAIVAAIKFLDWYTNVRDIPLEEDVIEQLDKLIIQTKDHSVAVHALNLQVRTGHIDEVTALSRIDEWKERFE